MLFKEIITVRVKIVLNPYTLNTELFIGKPGGTCSYHWISECDTAFFGRSTEYYVILYIHVLIGRVSRLTYIGECKILKLISKNGVRMWGTIFKFCRKNLMVMTENE
jgi:hypothetical protein